MSLTYVSSNLALRYYSLSYQRFTPSTMVDMSKERDWPANLGITLQNITYIFVNLFLSTGMLDWDSTGVLFTKRSLIEFLKLVLP